MPHPLDMCTDCGHQRQYHRPEFVTLAGDSPCIFPTTAPAGTLNPTTIDEYILCRYECFQFTTETPTA